MDSDTFALLFAAGIVLGGWAVIAAALAYLAHRRMRAVERELGSPALPPFEQPLAWMAGAAVAWPFAAVLAIIALVKRDLARLGRNLTLIFIGHMTAAVVAALVVASVNLPIMGEELSWEEIPPLVAAACVILAVSVLAATALAWVWVGRRSRRIQLQAPDAEARPGAWRFALYAASLLMWPVGIICAVVYAAPSNVHLGAHALRFSLLNVAAIAIATSIGLSAAAFAFHP